jgi:hypothetical protein
MQKETAFSLLGGTPATVARHLGCTKQAVHMWPPILPRVVADRVLAARVRLEWEIAHQKAPPGSIELPPLIADALSV